MQNLCIPSLAEDGMEKSPGLFTVTVSVVKGLGEDTLRYGLDTSHLLYSNTFVIHGLSILVLDLVFLKEVQSVRFVGEQSGQ